MSEKSENYCVNCKWCAIELCFRSFKPKESTYVDTVTGKLKVRKSYKVPPACDNERSSWLPWNCGKKGRFFQKK